MVHSRVRSPFRPPLPGCLAYRLAGCLALLLAATGCGDDPVDAPPLVIDSPEALITGLEKSYGARDWFSFTSLLAHEPAENADFLFSRSSSPGAEEMLWGFDAEVNLHGRMFAPDSILPTDPELHPDLWVRSITVSFRRATDFVEPENIYLDQGNSNGLDRARWRAREASYLTDANFLLETGSFFAIRDEESRFLVIEDLTKNAGDEGKFLLLRWEDRCSTTPGPAIAGEDCWNEIKVLYLGL